MPVKEDKIKELESKLQECAQEKSGWLKLQKYEQASKVRSKEVKLLLELEELNPEHPYIINDKSFLKHHTEKGDR